LGERLVRNQEVGGSSPPSSINPDGGSARRSFRRRRPQTSLWSGGRGCRGWASVC